MTGTDNGAARRRVMTPVFIALVAAMVAVVALVTTHSDNAQSSSASSGAQAASASDAAGGVPKEFQHLARRQAADPLARGKADAPVVMVEFSDFQCPYCGQFARTTEPKLVDKYVKQGVLRIEWRDFPYFGKESYTAALAARAAGEQGGFWKLHNALYEHQSPPNSGDLTTARIVSLATAAGLDSAKLRTDMKDPNLAKQVKADFAQGQSLGISGTPAFVINGTPVIGAQPLSVFEKTIEQAAKDAK